MSFETLYNCISDAVIDYENPFDTPDCFKNTGIYMGQGIWLQRVLPYPYLYNN